MNKIPFKNGKISNPDYLFGRKQDLELLCQHALRLDKLQLIGARRFGKTCLLQCLVTMLKKMEPRTVYPIFLDLHSDKIEKGTGNVYKYMVSKIVSSLYEEKNIDDIVTFENYTIKSNKSWRLVYNQLEIIDSISLIQEFFITLVTDYSEILETKFLLLFDEYEAMATSSFDRIDGFMTIRDLSDDDDSPICFWIAGATPWEEFVKDNPKRTIGGSGEFNGVTIPIYVRPIDRDSFNDMWNYECSKIDDESKRRELEKMCEKAYIASGGVPFYAKILGSYFDVNGVFPDNHILFPHFEELEKLLNVGEIKILRDIQRNPKLYKEPLPTSMTKLILYGLVKRDTKGKCSIPISLFADYIRAKIYEQILRSGPQQNSIDVVNRIGAVRSEINEKWKSIHNEYLFDPSNDEFKLYQYLSIRCDERSKFQLFINAIYLLHWEASKKNRGSKLPTQYKDSTFRKALDTLRHIYGNAHQEDKFRVQTDQFDKMQAIQEIIGSPTIPDQPADWLFFQKCMLEKYLTELIDICDSLTRH